MDNREIDAIGCPEKVSLAHKIVVRNGVNIPAYKLRGEEK